MKRTFVFLGALILSSPAMAGIWGDWRAGGTSCSDMNVQVIENGSSLSVLFDNFGVNMPQGTHGDGKTTRKTCNFRIQLTPPNGFYLARFRQLYSGGIIKSRGSSAQLNIRYNVGSVMGNPLPIVFGRGTLITPEMPQSLFQRTYNDPLLVANCGASTVYGINMQFSATRDNVTTEHLVGGLDSVDADFIQRVILIPEFELCR